MREMPPFELKHFFNQPLALSARANLSPSFAEPLSMPDLLALEPDAAERLASLPLGYTAAFGGADLRATIAARYADLDPAGVLLGCGADDVLAALFMALIQPGEHVIVHHPVYGPLSSVAHWCGAEITPWQAVEEQGWEPSLDELARLLRPATRMIVVNVPHSPTGYQPTRAWLERLVAIADDSGALLVGDEIYRGLPLGAEPEPPSLVDLSPHAVVLNSVSKSFGLPGLRAGWLATRNPHVVDTYRAFRLHLNTFLAAPVEYLTTLALRHADTILARNLIRARANMDVLRAFITRNSQHFSCVLPGAGVVAFPRWLGAGATTELSEHLLHDHHLLLAPSAYFEGGDRHVRIGFGTDTFPSALALLGEALAVH
jgi:aspartate/methionine/tyrosine aminotransferase